jgi:hypothetical protein
MVEELARVASAETQATHVRDIEEAGRRAALLVLLMIEPYAIGIS